MAPSQNTFDTEQNLEEVNREITETYDKQVYTSNAFSFSSPVHLRAAAHVWGLSSVSVKNARVLELGCAGGGNLLPFALAYPDAKAVGVDLSEVQVKQGRQVVQALGLHNLQLHAMSLTDIGPEFGQFDYIIAHGVFSWVPPEVREAMMRIMRENLAPEGIGYISYNTYPGWKAGDIVRDAMLLHSHSVADEASKLGAAKAMLNLLSEGIAASNPLAPSLRAAVAQLRSHSDYYIAHEYLELFNNPCYLLEFVNMADQFGVAHVGDSEPHVELGATYGQNVQLNHSLVALGQPRVVRQQYLDFAVGRNFRKSMIVHSERVDQLAVAPDLSRLEEVRWAGHFIEADVPEGSPKNVRSYLNHRNRRINTSEPAVVAVIQTVTRAWPGSVTYEELQRGAREHLPPEIAADEHVVHKTVRDAVETLFRLNSLRYTLDPSPYDTRASGERNGPELVPGFQYLYERRKDKSFGVGTFNLWHETVNAQFKEAEEFLLPYIDGKHSRKQLAVILRDALQAGKVSATDGKSLKGQRNLDALADRMVGKLLDFLRRHALLW